MAASGVPKLNVIRQQRANNGHSYEQQKTPEVAHVISLLLKGCIVG